MVFFKDKKIKLASEIDKEVERLPTGIDSLDLILDGGLPVGRTVSLKGMPTSCKTSLATKIIVSAQNLGWKTIFIDAERSLYLNHAEQLGVDLNKLYVLDPDTAEEVIEAIENNIDRHTLIVVDSLAAMQMKAEAESANDQAGVAIQARGMARFLRKLTPLMKNYESIIIWINQLRANLGGGPYAPYKETGGEALRFYTSVGIENKMIGRIKKGNNLAGFQLKIKLAKNKLGPPGRETEVKYFFEHGFDDTPDWLGAGEEKGLVTKKGAHYYWGETKLGFGKEKASENLTEEMITQIKNG